MGKVVVAEKIRFSKSLNKLFLNVDEVFENNDQKLIYDAAKPLSRTKMTITQTQVMFKELKQGKLPNNWSFFSQVEATEAVVNLRYVQWKI